MSGHSHWAGIKHKKGREDVKRGRLFSRLSKAIISATRIGGKNLDTNIALNFAVEEAKAANMPKDTIERAILKGAGELEGQQLESVRYEGYGSGGAAVIVEALTDNRNRTTAHVRRIFDDHNGKLGSNGCVAWIFNTKGLFILTPPEDRTEEEIFDVAVDAGAEDFQQAGEFYELTCPVTEFKSVMDALQAAGIAYESAQITEVPTSYVDLNENDGRKILKMLDALEEDEDVAAVHSNFNLPEELVGEMGEQ